MFRQQSLVKTLLIIASGLVVLSAPVRAQDQDDSSQPNADGQGQMMQQQRQGSGQGMMNRDSNSGGMMNRNSNGGGMMNQGQEGGGMNHGGGDSGMGGGMMQRMEQMHTGLHSADTTSGQSAFDLIKQVVSQMEANPDTDWTQVNISALRQHLVDMNQLTLYAEVEVEEIGGGARYEITGEGITLDAIQRMVPAHAAQLQTETSWNIEVDSLRDGVNLSVSSEDPNEAARIRGLGFMGFMVQGEHHEDHHLIMAGGQPGQSAMSHSNDAAMDHSDHQDGDHSGH